MKGKKLLIAGLAILMAVSASACDFKLNIGGNTGSTEQQGGSGSENPSGGSENENPGGNEGGQGGTESETPGGEQGNPGGDQGGEQGNPGGEETIVGEHRGITDTESIYAVGAVTTAKLLSFSTASATAADPDYGLPSGSVSPQVIAESEDFNKYFNMLDSFLDKAATTTVITDNTAGGELAQYSYRAVITGKNAEGGDVVHTLYYSENVVSDRNWTERDDGDVKEISERVYSVEGAVEMGTDVEGAPVYYYMTGDHTVRAESEWGESEKTETLRIRTSAERTSGGDYVELTHTVTTEEEQGEAETESLYLYSICSAGRIVERTQVEFEQETEHGETETEYEIKFLTGTYHGSYEIERESRNGQTWISVEYDVNGARGKFVILKQADGTYEYRYSQNRADSKTMRDYWD